MYHISQGQSVPSSCVGEDINLWIYIAWIADRNPLVDKQLYAWVKICLVADLMVMFDFFYELQFFIEHSTTNNRDISLGKRSEN